LPFVRWRLSSRLPLIRWLVVASPVVACLRLASPFVPQPPHASRRWRPPVHPVRSQSQPPPTHLWDFPVNNKYKMELIYYPTPAARDALPTMATPLLPPSASSAMSAAAASAARARAVATKSRDGSARRNLGLSSPFAFCPLAPLLPFASHLPAGCRIACCRVPPPRVTFRCAAASHVQTMATARSSGASVVATTPGAPV
jgi:hypothetical protein